MPVPGRRVPGPGSERYRKAGDPIVNRVENLSGSRPQSLASSAVTAAVARVGARALDAQQEASFVYMPKPRPRPAPLECGDGLPGGRIGHLLQDLDEGRTSCRALLQESRESIAQHDPGLNGFCELTLEQAAADAERLDAELSAGGPLRPLHGITVGVKDVIHVAGVPTRAGSAEFLVVPELDAPSVARLRQAGALLIGKTTTHEFALGVTTPQARNPHDATRIPGGSSGGSAIAVATGMAMAALATDTRASTRIPAALSGTVGFKPTFGLVPAGGLVQLSWSMDHIGAMTTSVADAAAVLDVLAATQVSGFSGADTAGLRVGLVPDGIAGADPGVLGAFQSAVPLLEGLVRSVVDAGRPTATDFDDAQAAGLLVSRCEAASYHRRLGLDQRRYWQETQDQLHAAGRVLTVDYLDAQRLRSALADRMLAAFDDLDVLIMPTSLVPAPRIEDADEYLLRLSKNAILWSFIGFPAVSIPCGTTPEGLPVGLQLVAPPYEESALVALGTALESALEAIV